MKKQLNEEFNRMQRLAGLIVESSDPKFDQIALDHSNTAPNTPPGATAGTSPSIKESKPPIYNVTTMDGKTVVGTHQYGIGFKANEVGKKMGFKDHPTSIPNKTKIDRTDDIEESVNEVLRKYRNKK